MAEFVFLHPLWLLAFIPLLLVLPWLKKTGTKTSLIAPHLATFFNQDAKKNNNTSLIILLLAWSIAVIALAGPSFKKQNLPSFDLSGARVLVMDMSFSLYAEDIKPNRLQQAKFKALDMLPNWQEGSTALVAYGADGYIVSPLTTDANTLKNLIPELSPQIMPQAGSNALGGVQQAIDLLAQANFSAGDIILISDEITQDQATDILKLVENKNYRISILAVGTQQGAPVPLPNGQLLTINGNTFVAKVDLLPMAKITQSTGGVLAQWQSTNSDITSITSLNDKPLSSSISAKNEEILSRINQGFWLIIPLLIIALISFRRGIVLSMALLLMPVDQSVANPLKTADQQGIALYKAKDFSQAAEKFSSNQWKGIAQYQAGNYQAAIDSLVNETDSISRYNLANAYAQNGDYEKALTIYDNILSAEPNHQDAKYNADIVRKMLEQQEQQNKDQNSKENNQDSESAQNDQNQKNQENSDSQSSDAQKEQNDQKSSQDSDKKAENQQNEQNAQQEQEQEQNKDSTETNNEQDLNESGEEKQSTALQQESGLTQSNPILKKLEQMPNNTSELIRAQLLLQAREKPTPEQSSTAW